MYTIVERENGSWTVLNHHGLVCITRRTWRCVERFVTRYA